MSEIVKEQRQMRANPNLVLQVIKSQAGTVAKAILEGVMNSIDQEAPNINVTITSGTVRIEDDGKGFAGQDVKTVFEEFGNPHPLDDEGFATDTKFGKFRIGRGQMFAFGKNIWRSAGFRMVTDVDHMGLEYEYEEGHPHQAGCIVEIALYESLSLREVQNTVDQITKFCRYTDSNLVVNGVSVAVNPATLKWDIVNDLAYINKKVVENRWRGNTGLDIYQQGVFVETVPLSEFGLEGTIVIRQEVSVNFARNQVIRRCKRWQKIAQMLKEEGINEAVNKKRLTREGARSFVEEFSGGDGDIPYNLFFSTACLPDITGKMWSPQQFQKLIHSRADSPRVLRDADGCISIGFAKKGDRAAEKVMQLKRAVVLDAVVLSQLRLDHIKDSTKRGKAAIRAISGEDSTGGIKNESNHDRFYGKLIYADYLALLEDVDDRDYHRLSIDEYNQRERDFLSCMGRISWHLDHEKNGRERENRAIGIGISDIADIWTDGDNHITFNRKWVAGLNFALERDWFRAGLSMARMFSYDEDSTESGDVEEGVDFLQTYVGFLDRLPDACRGAYMSYMNLIGNRADKLPQAVQNSIHKEAEAYAKMLLTYEAKEEIDAAKAAAKAEAKTKVTLN